MSHPLLTIPPGRRRRFFAPLLVLTLALSGVLGSVDMPLRTDAAPYGIVSFELAGDPASAQRMVDSWDARARSYAGFSLGIDFLYLLLYSTTIALACLWASDVFRGRGLALARAGVPIAWGAWLAGLLDGVENCALAVLLLGSVRAPWPAVAWWCAVPKFILIGAGLVYAGAAGLVRLVTRASSLPATSREVL